MLETTSCDAVMIGRGAVGNPWLFREAEARLRSGRATDPPTLGETLAVAIEQLDMMVEAKGEHRGVMEMRKHEVAYLRGFHGASLLRAELVRIDGHAAVRARLLAAADEYKSQRRVQRFEEGAGR
jgi:tRNA-dihydrouridine synthase B